MMARGGKMPIQLDQDVIHRIPASKRVREEKTPFAMAAQPGSVIRDAEFGESDEMHLLRLHVSAYWLDAALADADLSAEAAAAIHERFCGRIFDPDDLAAAIAGAQA